MKTPIVALVAAVAFTASVHAQTSVRVRGTITAIDGNILMVKSRDGKDLKLALPDNVAVAVAKEVKFEDLKEGDYVGATTKAGSNGTEVAVEVHYLAPTVPPGQLAWDLAPNTKMTNATVAGKVVGASGRELTLQWAGGTQKIVVPDGTALVRTVPGRRADLKVGKYIFTGAQPGADGTLTAARIQVSKDGVLAAAVTARAPLRRELPGLIVLHGLEDLVVAVHHERPVLRDRLAQRPAGDEQRARRRRRPAVAERRRRCRRRCAGSPCAVAGTGVARRSRQAAAIDVDERVVRRRQRLRRTRRPPAAARSRYSGSVASRCIAPSTPWLRPGDHAHRHAPRAS